MAPGIRLLILCFLASLLSFAAPALAQNLPYELLRCNNDQVMSGTQLLNTSPDRRNGETSFCSEVNPTSGGNPRIFSRIICSYVEILNQVMGRVYCGMQYHMQKYAALAIAIYLGIFGVQILSGVVQITTKEVFVRLMKVALVWLFVSNYSYGVNMLFLFFVDFANQSIWWTLGSVTNPNDPTPIWSIMNMPAGSATSNISATAPVYVYFDQLIYDVMTGSIIADNQKLLIFFVIVGAIYWPILMIGVYWLVSTFMILARGLISFLLCITALALLIAMSPIFFCLMLFKATQQFFETWLKFMISFSLQVMVVFAVIAMWLIVMFQFIGFFNQLANVIFPEYTISRTGNVNSYVKSFGVCPYVIEVQTAPTASAPLIGPNVRCADPTFTTDELITENPGRGNFTPRALANQNKLIKLTNIAPARAHQNCQRDPNCTSGNELVITNGVTAPQNKLARLAYYVIYHLILLSLVAYAFDALLRQAPMIAQQLAGPQYVPKLGQGFGGLGMGRLVPGSSRTREGSGSTGSASSIAGSAIRNILSNTGAMTTTRNTPGS